MYLGVFWVLTDNYQVRGQAWRAQSINGAKN